MKTISISKNDKAIGSSYFSDYLVDEAYKSLKLAMGYLTDEERAIITDACFFGDKAHIKDKRKSGEPYITHPFAVAEILAGFSIDKDTLVAAILHDTVEDTDVTIEEVKERYGEKVAELVDGVTKLKSSSHNKQQNKSATFHKILLSTLKDPRVLLIKLSDRLHNMSTLDSVSPDKQVSTAKETLDFYVPFARIMGMNDIADFIEILCYRNLDPVMYNKLSDKLLQHGLGRNFRDNYIQGYLQDLLQRKNIAGRIITIDNKVMMYRKFFHNQSKLNTILREYAFEMVLDDIESCRQLAEYLQKKYKIPDSQIADNITNPLPGGNQSLMISYRHYNDTIHLTIMTKQMSATAKLGVISASNTSEVSQSVIQASLTNLKELVNHNLPDKSSSSQSLDDASTNIDEHINTAVSTVDELMHYLHAHKILCFSPEGKAYELPIGSTALDFAYAVGPFIGNIAVSAIIDGVECELASEVSNGQEVKIITDKNSAPKADWIGFVCTSKARELINKWLNDLPFADKVNHGKQALERALQTYDKSLDDLSHADWQDILTWRGYNGKDDVYQAIASTQLLPQFVVARIYSDEIKNKIDSKESIKGATNLLETLPGVEISFPRCCNPIYGDKIMGYSSSKHGLVVHRHRCTQLIEIKEQFANRVFHIKWRNQDKLISDDTSDLSTQIRFSAFLEIETITSEQLTSEIVQRLRLLDIGVKSINNLKTTTELHVVVRSRAHLAQGIEELRSILDFVNVKRLFQQY